jgi:glucose-6-phosphate-specific signal transduction histidine kinase
VKELWAIALPHFEKLRMAKLICPPPLFLALNLRKKNVYYYISMKAYIVQIAKIQEDSQTGSCIM